MKKHAYLIMIHDYIEQAKNLIAVLDDVRNDIFLHVDAKYKYLNYDDIRQAATHAGIFFVDRMNVVWGSDDQIKCEINLIKAALSHGKYAYLHLLSGADFPIKSQDYIHDFFNENQGKEFVHFEVANIEGVEREKISLYHLLQHRVGSTRRFLYRVQRILVRVQRTLRIDRTKNDQKLFAKGANWFSITSEFAQYVVSQEKWLIKRFRYTLCADEIFLQTLLINSRFRDNLYYSKFDDNYLGCMRLIIWEKEVNHAHPLEFTEKDTEQLKESKMLFARKFSPNFNYSVLKDLCK